MRLLLPVFLSTCVIAQETLEDHVPCAIRLNDEEPPEAPHTISALTAQNLKSGGPAYQGTKINCVDGFASGYPCQDVNLYSMLDTSALNFAIGSTGGSSDALNDIWGWTDTDTAREFALVGLRRGTAFVEITDPVNPIYLGVLRAHNNGSSSWRDIKVNDHFAYIVSEQGGHGLQVFDLTILLTASPNTVFTETDHYGGFGNAHNIFINEDTGYAYVVGSNMCSGGLNMINLNTNPPSFAGCYAGDGYTHDVQCVMYEGSDSSYQGKEICFACNEDTITIVDVTLKNNPTLLSRTSYTGDRYTHQGWLTEDHNYFLFDDELDEYYGTTSKTKTLVMDVNSLTQPIFVGGHLGTTSAIDHNQYVLGDYTYQANYRAGLQVLKINDITAADMTQVAMFDVYPNSDSANFNGAWSNYPYFPSGTVVVSGIEQGLFILEVTFPSPPTPPPSLHPSTFPSVNPSIVPTAAPIPPPPTTASPITTPTASPIITPTTTAPITTPYPTGKAPTPYPTVSPPTPHPTVIPPTPHPTGTAPTPYPTTAPIPIPPPPSPTTASPITTPTTTAPITTPYPTEKAPTPYPTETPPTPHPTVIPPTPHPTGTAPVANNVAALANDVAASDQTFPPTKTCGLKNEYCVKHADCCGKRCNIRKKKCRG